MKHKPLQIRQGDIFIERVSKLPKKEAPVPLENGKVVLAHGEVTGHSHTIESPQLATMWKVKQAFSALGPDYALKLKEDTAVVHQEHGRIALPKGCYIVRRQREYAPESIRRAAD
jgi:hypothetical protein